MSGRGSIHAKARAILGAVAVAAALQAVAGSAEAAFPGNNGKVAFDSDRDTAAGEIYSITPGGSATRLTFSTRSSDPAYSPDGSRIAFISTKPTGTTQVWVMNADGSNPREITHTNTPKLEPAWSPDGTKIAYVANSFDVDGGTDYEIWTINADGSGRRQLTHNSIPDRQPAWSPSGAKIAFVSNGISDRDLYVMNASDGSGRKDITPTDTIPCSPSPCYQGHDDSPAWSPDGGTIAYQHTQARNATGPLAIWTVSPSGGDMSNLSGTGDVAFTQPAWSPEGDKIAVVGAIGTDRDIWVMSSGGSGPTDIDPNSANEQNPDWQPLPVCTDVGTSGNDVMNGTSGRDVLCAAGGDDKLNGLGGNDILLGGAGSDMLNGSAGNDILNGGPGVDTASYANSTAGISASLVTGFATGQGSDVLLGVENMIGSSLADSLMGSAAANLLSGAGGADVAHGAGANDTVFGGAGPDELFGDAGGDTVNSHDGVNGNDAVNGGTGTDTCVTDASELSVTGCP
jgi:Tol biopolymer transport system component